LLAPVTTATVSLDHHLKAFHFQKHFRESTQLRERVQEKNEVGNCRSEDHTLWKFFMSSEDLSIYLTSQLLSPCCVNEIWSRSWILETGLL
jgi:hypothetical protein